MSNPQVQHSKLSFSGRERWRACPISVQLSAGVPDKPSPAAEEGTRAHLVAEWYVRQLGEEYGLGAPSTARRPPYQTWVQGLDRFNNKADTELIQEEERWNEELRENGKKYRDFILSLIPTGEQAFIVLEQKVCARTISEHLCGTADCLVWLPRLRKLIVVDYKYGFVDVSVGTENDANPQVGAYAVAAIEEFGFVPDGGVELAIFQPRRSFGQPKQTLSLPFAWIADERGRLAQEVAAVAWGGEPNPGPHCRYCKGRSKCSAVHDAISTVIQAQGGAVDLLSIPRDDLITLWAAKTAFKAFWEDVEEIIEQEVKAGNPQLVVKETKGRAMWADPGAAVLTLLALGHTHLLKPGNVSDCAPLLPEEWKSQLIGTSAPSRSIRLKTEVAPSEIAATFAKYIKPVDNVSK